MQHARDTFYVTLRDRLAAVNPVRSIVLRGVSRPGVLVAENELLTAQTIPDTFVLRWTTMRVEAGGTTPLALMACEIRYATDGTAGASGMDRGQTLRVMDAELLTALTTEPRHVQKQDFSAVPATTMGTDIFWGALLFKEAETHNERLSRVVTLEIGSYVEAGEL